ncbi:MAG TPA: extracellular solute-binding protein [Verrucomicrobiae bacterium]|jgi:iron(III) transport system substrate-binding protein|nr:extracellular solute-binding protein [Verrucomicrobiae bacterium]
MKTSAVLSVIVGYLFFASLLCAQSPAPAVLEAAKKEGRLTWYTSMAIDTSKPLLDAFLREYPFIKGELARLGEEQLLNRILTEARAGRVLFDVVSSSGIQLLAQKNFLAPYASAEAQAFPPELKDPAQRWTAVYNNNLVVMYNTKMVAERDAPRDYPDLLDPKWKNKMLMDATDYDWYGTLAQVWGKEKAQHYMERLAQQEPSWRRGHGLVAQLVAAGEVPLGWAYSFRVERMKREGAPVDWSTTFNPIVTTISGMGLSAKATAPNTAKLFIDFVLSKKAQEMIREMRRIPSRGDVKPAAPKMDQSKLKLKLVPAEVSANADRYAEEFRKIFGL